MMSRIMRLTQPCSGFCCTVQSLHVYRDIQRRASPWTRKDVAGLHSQAGKTWKDDRVSKMKKAVKWVTFDSAKLFYTIPFEGNRISIVFFGDPAIKTAKASDKALL